MTVEWLVFQVGLIFMATGLIISGLMLAGLW